MDPKKLLDIAQEGAHAYGVMLDINGGIGAVDKAERDAIHRYDVTFGLSGDGDEVVAALAKVAAAAERVDVYALAPGQLAVIGFEELKAALDNLRALDGASV